MADRWFGYIFIGLAIVILATVPLSIAYGDPIWLVALIVGTASLVFGVGLVWRRRRNAKSWRLAMETLAAALPRATTAVGVLRANAEAAARAFIALAAALDEAQSAQDAEVELMPRLDL